MSISTVVTATSKSDPGPKLTDAVGDELNGERPAGNARTEKAEDTASDTKPDPLRRMASYCEPPWKAAISLNSGV